MKTAKKYSAIESVEDNCEKCYNGIFIEKCKNELNLCKSKIDGLQIFQDLPWERLSSSTRTEMKYINSGHGNSYDHESKNNTATYSIEEVSRNNLNTVPIYCIGFKYFLSQEDVCDTVDAMSVYSKGLEIIFAEYVNATIVGNDINIKSLFEVALSTNGNGEQTIVQAEIHGAKEPTREDIEKVLLEIYEMQQLPPSTGLSSLEESKLFETESIWNETQEVWSISFYLTAVGSDIF